MRIILTFLLIHGLSFAFAQINAPINIDLHRKLQSLQANGQTDQVLHVLVKGKLDAIEVAVREYNGVYKYGIKDIASVKIPASAVYRMVNQPDIKRIEWHDAPAKLLGDFIRINNNLDSLHSGFGELPQGLTGDGVVVGVIDSGIEWRHPDIQNSDSTTRIKYVWDQLHPFSNTPQYSYGYEWNEADINSGDIQHDPFVEPTYGHGNGTVGVACGNGSAAPGEYTGAAPESDIVYVNIDLNSGWFTKFLDGLHYIFTKADELGQPCVVNSSVGSYRGPHDTRGLEVQMIEYMLDEKPGRVLVQAAGNGAIYRQHLGYQVTTDTVFSWFKVNVFNLGYTYFDLYADKADFDDVYFSIGLRRKSDYSLRHVTPFFNLQTDFPDLMTVGMDSIKRTLYDDETGDKLGDLHIFAELNQGVYDMAFVVLDPANTSDYWELTTTGDGKFDVWSNGTLMGTSSVVTPDKVPDASVFPYIEKYIFADTLKSIVSSWNCSEKVISVANYSNRTSWEGYDNMTYSHPTPAQHKLPNSSVGPTRTGLQKPNIAASGNFTFGLQAIERLEELRNDPDNPDRLAPEGWHVRWSGTSIAAPIVAGTVACYLQQFPNATYAEIIAGIENSAKVDEYVTMQYGPAPNYGWGYGKLDGFNLVNNAVIAVNTENPLSVNAELYNIPNPSRHSTRIFYKINEFKYSDIQINITDILGHHIHTEYFDTHSGSFLLNTGNLNAGAYFYSLTANGNIFKTGKLLVTH